MACCYWSQYYAVGEIITQGIIGANPGNEYNISGVAYDATIYAYRIFGCNGGSSSQSQFYPIPQ